MGQGEEVVSLFYIGTAIMLFLAFGLMFIVVTYQRHFFRMKRKEAENMLRVSLESEKNERARIAADLHDGVSGDLSAIKNYLSVLAKKESVNQTIFDEIKEGVDAALQNTRAVSHNLMPPLLETEGLVPALKNHLNNVGPKAQIEFEVITNGVDQLPPLVAYQLFRVLQELTTNMIKYGNVSKSEINLLLEKDSLKIEISDNGVPFNFKENLAKPNASGLKNITSRLHAIGGTIVQNEEKPKGNQFTITIKNINHA
ncbi:hypothetical protein Q763_13170 [Flavobacterium beibuense F44-8]|uniref:histidine kinase n=1 Tax=Flavobacterium beibuense F44-8 TaxID=1406840 RepID=A0A0A2LH30_9FLAO|nr:histidine kinase [Flavobacterium beibuense]KGO79497.1 hypothetical protein Q763_13170 [Flavobacterium beibuense F44-8]